jgi:predicted nucleic acid-binding protein
MNLPKNFHRIGLDANILIYHFRAHPSFGKLATGLLDECKKRKSTISAIVFSEIFVSLFEREDTSLIKKYQSFLDSFPKLKIVSADKQICLTAAQLRAAYRLKTPDAIHISTAIHSGCDTFITNDANLKKVQEITVLTLRDIKG